MNFLKMIIFSFVFLSSANIVAREPFSSSTANVIYAGGAAGQRAQCPFCDKYYYVGTNHKCTK